MERLSKQRKATRLQPYRPATPEVGTTAQRYKLTSAEKRVLSAVMDSGGVRSVASALGISEATVKTHLQNIFGKTGARRQIDLVRLVIAAGMSERTNQLFVRGS